MAIEVNIVRNEKSPVRGGSLTVLEADGNYYVASSIPAAPDTGQPETLVFKADSEGTITDWGEVCGGMHVSMDEAIRQLRAVLNGERGENTLEDSPIMQHAGGDPLTAMLNSLTLFANPPGPDYYEDDENEDG